jgi:hypothetical protein
MVDVKFIIPKPVSGFQWTLELNGLEYIAVRSKDIYIDDTHIGQIRNDVLTMSWNGEQINRFNPSEQISFEIQFKVTESGPINEMLKLSNAITAIEAYSPTEEILDVELIFNEPALNKEFALHQNRPNPWNNHTLIGFDLPSDAQATLTLYDVTGKVLKTVTGDYKEGYNTIILASREMPGKGIYYYRLDSGSYSATKKMVIQ